MVGTAKRREKEAAAHHTQTVKAKDGHLEQQQRGGGPPRRRERENATVDTGGKESDNERSGDGARDASWSCLSCSFENSGLLSYCEICEMPREKEVSYRSTDRGTASPSSLLTGGAQMSSLRVSVGARDGNSGSASSCSVATTRSTQPQGTEATPGSLEPRTTATTAPGRGNSAGTQPDELAAASFRACPLCSFHNEAARSACEICEAPLPLTTPCGTGATSTTTTSGGAESTAGGVVPQSSSKVELKEAEEEEERRLLLSMGWVPMEEEEDGQEDGGLEDWEIDAAQESLIKRLQSPGQQEGLRERAQRGFEAWKTGKVP